MTRMVMICAFLGLAACASTTALPEDFNPEFAF